MEERCGHILKKIGCLFEHKMRKESLGLSGGQCFFITYLDKHQGVCKQSEMENIFGTRRSSISSLLSSLEEEGLIEREENIEDKRQKNIKLTEKGKNISLKMKNNVKNAEETLTKGLTNEEIKTFLEIAQKMKNNLEEVKV